MEREAEGAINPGKVQPGSRSTWQREGLPDRLLRIGCRGRMANTRPPSAYDHNYRSLWSCNLAGGKILLQDAPGSGADACHGLPQQRSSLVSWNKAGTNQTDRQWRLSSGHGSHRSAPDKWKDCGRASSSNPSSRAMAFTRQLHSISPKIDCRFVQHLGPKQLVARCRCQRGCSALRPGADR